MCCWALRRVVSPCRRPRNVWLQALHQRISHRYFSDTAPPHRGDEAARVTSQLDVRFLYILSFFAANIPKHGVWLRLRRTITVGRPLWPRQRSVFPARWLGQISFLLELLELASLSSRDPCSGAARACSRRACRATGAAPPQPIAQIIWQQVQRQCAPFSKLTKQCI
jgi:hypothetical protein